jgi:hypothetical protein
VPDLGGLRARPARAEEDEIARLQLVAGDPDRRRHTNPEQSKPPGAGLPKTSCGLSEVPAKTYGDPTKRSARVSTVRCQSVMSGATKVLAASRTAWTWKSVRVRNFATE